MLFKKKSHFSVTVRAIVVLDYKQPLLLHYYVISIVLVGIPFSHLHQPPFTFI